MAILRKTIRLIPGFSPFETFANFEAALWTASRVVYTSIQMEIWVFHHCQSIYQQITDLCLGMRYQNDTGTQVICQKIMSKIFSILFVVCVQAEFESLWKSFNADPLLSVLFEYYLVIVLKSTWLSHSVWSIIDIDVYYRPIRTNNDSEGYHRRLNSKAGGRISVKF